MYFLVLIEFLNLSVGISENVIPDHWGHIGDFFEMGYELVTLLSGD